MGNILESLILQPIFNLLLTIYGLIPGHDFGLTLITFTLIVKLLLWKRTKKQFESSRKIRELQPQITKLKKTHQDDKRAQQMAIAQLYKANDVNALASIGNLVIQLPIIYGLFFAVRRLSADNNTEEVSRLGYSFVKDIDFIKQIIDGSVEIKQSLLGFIDLSRTALGGDSGEIYIPLFIVALIASAAQFMQTRQMMASVGNGDKKRGLREILKDESKGNQASQSEITAAATKSMSMFMPIITFVISIGFNGAVAFYWMVSNIISFVQQRMIRARLESSPPAIKVTYKKAGESKTKPQNSKKSGKSAKYKSASRAGSKNKANTKTTSTNKAKKSKSKKG